MKKDILRYIKNDMWEVRHCKKDVQAQLKQELAELEARRKEALADYVDLPEDDWYRVFIGASSRDIRLETKIRINGNTPYSVHRTGEASVGQG